ncbi:MAG: polysaccharide ABC transporter ATP-binding protein [Bacteroidia bacterium]|nr:polysaccharide ABC transporter ATP-binding protein [Bacteroidia bacterium]MDW8015416.1 polysaccharide ABC transporter ATP-binding protein [Bacteroidia bacterium]
MSQTPIIQIVELSKKYRIRPRERYIAARERLNLILTRPWKAFRFSARETFWALRDISFEVEEGEVIGIIGRNGAGKTTLLKLLSRITEPTEGYAILRGRVGSLLEVGTGFHPELTGRENIYFNGVLLGMSKEEVRRKLDEIVEFANVGEFLDMPIKHYSSGMAFRLAFSVAAHLEPEILIVDEVLAVGDIEFQKKCLNKMEEVSRRAGRTVLLVSHQLNQIRQLCTRVVWLEAGRIRMIGPTLEVTAAYEKSITSEDERLSPGQRTSSQKGSFRRWRLIQPSEAPHILSTFGPVSVEFQLEINKPLRGLVHGVALMTLDQRVLWSTYNNFTSLKPGVYHLLYNFEMLPLNTGMYLWRVSLYDEDGLVDVWDGLPYMEVQLPNFQHMYDNWIGPMNLPHRKEVRYEESLYPTTIS